MFGFVILNYMNYMDTLEAVENVSGHSWSHTIKIYVVDNGSPNESVEKIEELQKKIDFTFIKSPENLGYGRGSNLGIRQARKDGCDFVLELNSDARVLEQQDDFLNKIVNIYETKEKVALITTDIKNLDGLAQNPMDRYEFSFKKKLFLKTFFTFHLDKIYYFLRIHLLYSLVNLYVNWKYKNRKIKESNETPESGYIYAALGSCQILTPLYFENFDGHDESVFLYCEEYIKAEHLKKLGLKTWYESSLHVLHKESQTVEMITKSHKNKVKFLLGHMFRSGRVFTNMLRLAR